jgi:alpha/beta superfamily hydrolase
MSEEHIFIESAELKLEAIHEKGSLNMGLAAAHPHPLYGGSMDDWVVDMIITAARNAGWDSLRFNFRGVGQSQGIYDGGQGEVVDITAAASYLINQGNSKVLVAGYSFGAWVASLAFPELEKAGAESLILLAPPLAMMDFQFLVPETKIGLIIAGEDDEIAPPHLALELGNRLVPPLTPVIIEGSNHFFGPGREEVILVITEYLEKLS